MLEQSAELGTVSGESTHGDCREGRLAVYCACDGARSGAGKANARGETTEEATWECVNPMITEGMTTYQGHLVDR